MHRVEEIAVAALLVFFIALLSTVALASNLWPLWLAVALLVRALIELVRPV